jgi:hypothetical protein
MNRPTNKKTTNDLVHNLYIKPTKDKGSNAPKYPDFQDNYFHQADLLFLPEDNGYNYALVVVDVGSRLVDAKPIKNKTPDTVLKALKLIYKGKYLKPVTNLFGVDSGSEFKGAVTNYIEDELGAHMKVGKPDRHRQQSIVERKNRDIGKLLFKRMVAEELQTNVVSKAWVDYLPTVIDQINKNTKKNRKRTLNKKLTVDDYQCDGDACILIDQGTKVRVALDTPINVYDNSKLKGRFRETDIRFSIKPRTVMKTLVAPGNPPMYLLDKPNGDVDYSVAYTKNQLQIIPEKEEVPKEALIQGVKEKGVQKYYVEKLLERKKINNKIMFKIKWKGFKSPTWEPRALLIKDIKDLVLDFERSLK